MMVVKLYRQRAARRHARTRDETKSEVTNFLEGSKQLFDGIPHASYVKSFMSWNVCDIIESRYFEQYDYHRRNDRAEGKVRWLLGMMFSI